MTRPPAETFEDLIVWRRGRADKARHMNIAQGSLEELRYHFILCGDLQYLKQGIAAEQIAEVGRLLNGYTQSLQS